MPGDRRLAARLPRLVRRTDRRPAKDPKPTEEALQVLRGLLEAWQELAARPAALLTDLAPEVVQRPVLSPRVPAGTLVGAGFAVGSARR
jgi:hypothetical protein